MNHMKLLQDQLREMGYEVPTSTIRGIQKKQGGSITNSMHRLIYIEIITTHYQHLKIAQGAE